MTRKEAITVLNMVEAHGSVVVQAKEMAIKALEQEPCEDCISRQAVLNEIPVLWNSNGDKDYCMESLRDFVAELPPVTPQPKTGHWIDREVYDADRWECSECGRTEQYKENYCPNCGARWKARIKYE